jgi:hypothetical protein
MSCGFILNLIFLIIGWSTALTILFIAILMEYRPYSSLKPDEFVFYQTEEFLTQNQTSNYGYMIKNGTNLSDFTMCTRFSRHAFTRMNSLLDNNIIVIAYFASISLFLLTEIMDTFVFAKKYCIDNSDTDEYELPNENDETSDECCDSIKDKVKTLLKKFLVRFGSFLIKINAVSGFFVLGIIDYDNKRDCFQLKVSEFFLDIAYYSIFVSILSILVGIFLLIVNILIVVALFDAVKSCNIDCFRFLKICFHFIHVIVVIFVLLVVANVCLYFILNFGKADARIINALMTVNMFKTMVVKFNSYWSCCENDIL